ncbi:hypothetical protein PAMA_016321 [Pampus argenteus]
MDYYFLKGFLAVWLMQHCLSEGLPTSIQSSTVTLEDVQALPQEPELPPAEVVPVVSPPSLKEVQQAMQEASEQVEGRGAEEVLKELLERVVEAALGQVEGGSEGKVDKATIQEGVEVDALGAEKGKTEANTIAELLEQAVEEEEVEGEDTTAKGGVSGTEKEQEVAEMDSSEDAAEDRKRVREGEGETAAGSVEETTAGVETGSRETVGAEIIDESLATEVSQEVVEETVATLVETEGDLALEEAEVEANNNQAVFLEEEREAEAGTQEAEETPTVVEVVVGGGSQQLSVVESDHSLGVGDVEQIEDVWGVGEALQEETQVDETEGEVVILPFDNHEIETTQIVVEEPVEEEQVNTMKGQKVEDERGHLVVEGGATEKAEAVGAETGEAAGDEEDGESVIKEVLVIEGGDQQAGEEEQIALETSHGSEKEDHDVLVISGPELEDGAEASIDQRPQNQAPTRSPSLGVVETGENTGDSEKSNHDIEIVTPTDDLSPHDPVDAQPTLHNFVKDVLAGLPQAEGQETGEVIELVENTAGTTETKEMGLEAWKIGAISAAVFLVLETVVVIIYILKCRNKNRIALEPSDAASTLAQNKEQQEEEHEIAMSDLLPGSTEESANNGPDSSQDLRTSIL